MNAAADSDRLKKHLSEVAIPRDIFSHPQNLLKIQNYIVRQLAACGYRTTLHPFSLEGTVFNNIIGRAPDFDEKKPQFIIGAHFDAMGSTPGADDNATGVAALLETARVLSLEPAGKQIEFVAFNAEEYGISGSGFYAQELKKNKALISGMVSLEMLGYASDEPKSQQLPLFLKPFYPDVGNFIALVSDTQSRKLLDKAKVCFKKIPQLPVETLTIPMKGRVFPDVRLSDHAPFWDADYPALLITDTSFFRNPHYHTAEDRIESINLDFLTHVTNAVIQLGLSLP